MSLSAVFFTNNIKVIVIYHLNISRMILMCRDNTCNYYRQLIVTMYIITTDCLQSTQGKYC